MTEAEKAIIKNWLINQYHKSHFIKAEIIQRLISDLENEKCKNCCYALACRNGKNKDIICTCEEVCK